MLFWLFAIAVTAICCVALYYASVTGAVNAGAGEAADVHYRLQLAEINADIASGEMPAAEGEAAKGELAREFLRLTREARNALPAGARRLSLLLPAALVVIAGIAFATYAMIGNPGIPSQPLAGRTMPTATNMDLDEAVKRIEDQLKTNPDDLRGWTVIAPVYRGLGRYDDAINAYRRVLALSAPTADTETDLAETLLLKAGGGMVPEALQLLQSAAKRDPNHVRSRFYLAGYATEQKNYADAVAQWKALLELSTGAICSLFSSRALPAPSFPGEDFRFRITGSTGLLDLDPYGELRISDEKGWRVASVQPPVKHEGADTAFADVRMQAYCDQMAAFIQAIQGGPSDVGTGADGRAGVAAALAMIESSAAKRWIYPGRTP